MKEKLQLETESPKIVECEELPKNNEDLNDKNVEGMECKVTPPITIPRPPSDTDSMMDTIKTGERNTMVKHY